MSFVGDSTIAIVRDIKKKRLVLYVFILLALVINVCLGALLYIQLLQVKHLAVAVYYQAGYLATEFEDSRYRPASQKTNKKNARGEFFRIQGNLFYILKNSEPLPDSTEDLSNLQKLNMTDSYLVTNDDDFEVIKIPKSKPPLPAKIKNRKLRNKKDKTPEYLKPIREYRHIGDSFPDTDALQEILDKENN